MRDERTARDLKREESVDQNLVTRVWTRRKALFDAWDARCEDVNMRNPLWHFPWWVDPSTGFKFKFNGYIKTAAQLNEIWAEVSQMTSDQQEEFEDLYEEGLKQFDQEVQWTNDRPHLTSLWSETAEPPVAGEEGDLVVVDELAEVKMYGAAGPQDPDAGPPPEYKEGVLSGKRGEQFGPWELHVKEETRLRLEAADDATLGKVKILNLNKIPGYLRGSTRQANDKDITVVTQLSVDRLPQLEAMCAAWNGVVSAAVLVPPPGASGQQKAHRLVQESHARVEGNSGRCLLNSCLVEAPLGMSGYDAMYPINALRNAALDQAETELIFLLDVDFVPSSGLCSSLAQGYTELKEACTQHRVALVVPAFEMNPELPAARLKESLLGNATPFHEGHFPKGHRPTAYPHWWDTSSAYAVDYALCYEPYVVVAREGLARYDERFRGLTLTPTLIGGLARYDERFRGYGMNKIVHILALHSHGARFWVLPHEFVTAETHPKSKSWVTTYESSRGELQRRRIASLFRQVRCELAQVKATTWREQLESRTHACDVQGSNFTESSPVELEKWWLQMKISLGSISRSPLSITGLPPPPAALASASA